MYQHQFPSPFTSEELATMPYNVGDTIVYSDSLGNVKKYIVSVEKDTNRYEGCCDIHGFNSVGTAIYQFEHHVHLKNAFIFEKDEMIYSLIKVNPIDYQFKRNYSDFNAFTNFYNKSTLFPKRTFNSIEYDSVQAAVITFSSTHSMYNSNVIDNSSDAYSFSDTLFYSKTKGIIGWKSPKTGNWYLK